MTRLFVSPYTDENQERNDELVYCLTENKKVFDEVIELEGWPTYSDYFKKINEVTKEDDVSVIANLDILFTEECLRQIEDSLKSNECYALSRWDKQPDGSLIHFNRSDSQDCWIVKGKPKDVPNCDFTAAKAGCDNAIAERLNSAGYIVLNPSKDIKTIHVHLSQVRNYNPKIKTERPYLLVLPHRIGEQSTYRTILKGQ